MERGLSMRTEPDDGGVLLVVSGELDLATASDFEAELRRRLAAGRVRLDLTALSFMDSSGLRALGGVLRDREAAGWALAVVPELRDNVREILEMTGMAAVLPFESGGAGAP